MLQKLSRYILSKFNKDFQIDIVYMWVDGSDQKWNEEKNYWAKKLNESILSDNNKAQFVDNEELKFALRSVEKNMPWINKIFIVTNGQVPNWLDTTNPKIRLVNHSEFMPKEALPTFSSCAIESYIANIPDLSEHFLLANDDCFIYKPVKPSFFFTRNGKPIVRLKKQKIKPEGLQASLYYRTIELSRNLIKSKYGKYYEYTPHHNIDAYSKTEFKNCVERKYKEEFDKAIYSKFRTESVQRVIIALDMIANKKCRLKLVDSKLTKKRESARLDLASASSMKKKIQKYSPTLLCINDVVRASTNNRERLKTFLYKLFPVKSGYEKEIEFKIASKDSDISVVFSVTKNYAKYFGVALYSLVVNANTKLNYDIVVLDYGVRPADKVKLLNMIPDNFNLRFIDISIYMRENNKKLAIKSNKIYNVELLDKLFIPLLFKDYKRILYIDSDTCICNDLSKLFNINLDGSPIGAVTDYMSKTLKRYKDKYTYLTSVLNIKNPENYFNTGVMVFDIEKINTEKYIKNVEEATTKAQFDSPASDILNIIFNRNIKTLPTEWNYMYSSCLMDEEYLDKIPDEYRKEYIKAQNNPKIIHFDSFLKPWVYPKAISSEVFWGYARRSPFYEDILFTTIYATNILKHLNVNKMVYFNYYKAKILLMFARGNKRKSLKLQKKKLKKIIRIVRRIERMK